METVSTNNQYKNISSSDQKAWYGLVKEWEASSESQTQFCHNRGLNKNTFCYWRGKYLESGKNKKDVTAPVVQPSIPKLVPVRVISESVLPSKKTPMMNSVRLETPQGYVLTLPPAVEMNDLVKLLQQLESHHA